MKCTLHPSLISQFKQTEREQGAQNGHLTTVRIGSSKAKWQTISQTCHSLRLVNQTENLSIQTRMRTQSRYEDERAVYDHPVSATRRNLVVPRRH